MYQSPKQIANSLELAKLINPLCIDDFFWINLCSDDFPNIVKHPCYRYENEYRIVIKHGKNEPVINNVYSKDEDAFYIPISLKSIRKVVVGPNNDCESIRKFFASYLSEVKFSASEIPYRSKK